MLAQKATPITAAFAKNPMTYHTPRDGSDA